MFGLTVRAASVRGLFKRYVGGPRQDDLCLAATSRAARWSSPSPTACRSPRVRTLGAALAVRHAAAAVVRQLPPKVRPSTGTRSSSRRPGRLVERAPPGQSGLAAGVAPASGALATTLTVAMIGAEEDGVRARVAAVSDSPALVLGHGIRALTGPATRADGLTGGDGGAAAPPRAWTCGEVRLEPRRGAVVCTDGVGLPLGDGTGEVGSRAGARARATARHRRLRAAGGLQRKHVRRRPYIGRGVGGRSVSAVLARDAGLPSVGLRLKGAPRSPAPPKARAPRSPAPPESRCRRGRARRRGRTGNADD